MPYVLGISSIEHGMSTKIIIMDFWTSARIYHPQNVQARPE